MAKKMSEGITCTLWQLDDFDIGVASSEALSDVYLVTQSSCTESRVIFPQTHTYSPLTLTKVV